MSANNQFENYLFYQNVINMSPLFYNNLNLYDNSVYDVI